MATHDEWDSLEGQFITSLREKAVQPVPEPIIKLAQRSLDGNPAGTDEDGNVILRHAMEHKFESVERATRFANHMRNAGPHTTPESSVTVLQDPHRTKVQATGDNGQPKYNDAGKPVMVDGPAVDPTVVRWRAGAKKGRKV